MSEREPEEGAGERPERDPVNHHPPEEWRPGDPGDPIGGGPQPPGEPEHGFPDYGPPLGEARGNGGPSPDQPSGTPSPGDPPPIGSPYGGSPPPGQPAAGQPPQEPFQGGDYRHGTPPGGQQDPSRPPAAGHGGYGGLPPGGQPPQGQPRYGPPGGHPTGGPPEPVDRGELSEGPSGPSGAGPEHQGYAPGYGEYPSEPVGYGPAGGYGPPGQGGYGPPPPKPTPWGKILGIGCGVLLLVLLLMGGCAAVLLVMAGDRVPGAGGPPGAGQPGTDGRGEATEAELTAASTGFQPSSLYTGGEYTSVRVSVTNAGQDALDVNPLYFTVVDVQGAEHSPGDAIAMDANEIGVHNSTAFRLVSALEAKGAKVIPVQVYAYGAATDSSAVREVIERIMKREIDVAAFTSAPQVHMLFDIAGQLGLSAGLAASLKEHVTIASIGEVTNRALAEKGLEDREVHFSRIRLDLADALLERADLLESQRSHVLS